MSESNESDGVKYFDYYEITGILAPGALFLFGMSRIFHESSFQIETKEMTVGDLGLFTILSYAAGHLIQIAGNVLETAWWFICSGYPSSWVLNEFALLPKIIPADQKDKLKLKIHELLHEEINFIKVSGTHKTHRKTWHFCFRRIYGLVAKAKLAQRADSFNRTYGMLRGMTAVLLCFAVTLFWNKNCTFDLTQFFLLFAAAASLMRMHLFGMAYAREVFVQFFNLKSEDLKPAEEVK